MIYLIKNRDRVVTRQELLQTLWQGRVVSDSALSARLKAARKAVGDTGGAQEIIKTIHGRGYQFIAEATEINEKDAQSDSSPQLKREKSPLPDKPSIAVLPFQNLSNDPEQEFFSEGITEDIITELSKFRELFVIARNSSFVYGGKAMDVRDVSQELGVQYILEGSVRKAKNQVRISAQLIEGESGNHIWAERYDRELEDIFAVQDEVTQAIVSVLLGRVEMAVAERAQRKPTDNIKAYELVLLGKMHFDRFNADDVAESLKLFKKATELDPTYARAYAYLADAYLTQAFCGWATADYSDAAIESAKKAAILGNNDILCEEILGWAYIEQGLWEESEKQFEKVLSQIGNEAGLMVWAGDALNSIGRHEEGRKLIEDAMRLNPLHPPLYKLLLGITLYSEKRYEDVTQVLVGGALLNPIAYTYLAGAYAQLGNIKEARRALNSFIVERRKELSRMDLHIEADTIGTLTKDYHKNFKLDADWEHYLDGLRKAGLSD